MIDSRAKGKRGELEACKALAALTGIEWMRTSQVCGKYAADVVPVHHDIGIHVEVKRCKRGMSHLEKRLKRSPLWMCGDLFVSRLATLPRLLDCTMLGEKGKRTRKVEGWMRQAQRDCKTPSVPIVLFRQDDLDWCIAWMQLQDDHVMKGFKKCAAFATAGD